MTKIRLSLKTFEVDHYSEDKITDFKFIPRVNDIFEISEKYYRVKAVIHDLIQERGIDEYVAEILAYQIKYEDIIMD